MRGEGEGGRRKGKVKFHWKLNGTEYRQHTGPTEAPAGQERDLAVAQFVFMIAQLGKRSRIHTTESSATPPVAKLREFLDVKGIWHNFISKSETVHTVDAAKATGIDLTRLTKNLVAVTDDGVYVLIIIPGDKRADLGKAARALGASKVSLLPFEKAEQVSGYPPGGTPSLGHRTKMIVLIDEPLLKNETIFCGGGSKDRVLELRTRDVVVVNEAKIVSLTRTT